MISCWLWLVASAAAGGWTQPAGAHYLKVSQRTLIGDQGFDLDGETFDLDGGRYSDFTMNIYGEWGVTDDWTLVITSTPIGRGYVETATQSRSGWYSGTSLVGVRRRLSDAALKLAAEARAGGVPPLGAQQLAADVGQGWFWQTTVPTAQAEAEIQAGVGLPWGWAAASVGGRWQSAAELPAVSILGTASIGWTGKRLGVSLQLSTVQPLEPVTALNISGAGATRYIGVEPGLSVPLGERLSLVASMGGVLTAQANAATPAINVGVAHR
ncbi:MAG: hypothetical protein AAFV53_20635 [Myxococcota bacterium]